jgi:hypothetical protein
VNVRQLTIQTVCLAALLVSQVFAQDNSSNKNANSQITATPARIHRQVRKQIATAPPTAAPVSKPTNNVRVSYADALRHYQHTRHNRVWWKQHFTTIVLVGGGYYYWDAGYWCPAWGYDSAYEYYDYDGPIYTYGNLLPDQVVINVQRALQQLGYYSGSLTGSLNSNTRAAIAAYQQDAGLYVNGIVEAPTVEALGLY